jgi:hypothetical protein
MSRLALTKPSWQGSRRQSRAGVVRGQRGRQARPARQPPDRHTEIARKLAAELALPPARRCSPR